MSKRGAIREKTIRRTPDKIRTLAVQRLKELQELDDHELAHQEADEVLCGVMQSLGYLDVVNEWAKIKRYYCSA
jgi:hypothetical protein